MASPSGSNTSKYNIPGYRQHQMSNFTPEMQQLFQKLLGGVGQGSQQGLDYLSKVAGGDEDIFAQIEKPAYEAFNKQAGNISSRFSGMGARDSSAFQNAMFGASSQMSQDLAANRHNIQSDAINKLLGYSTSLLDKKPYENVLEKKDSDNPMGELLGKLLPVLLQMLA